MEKVKRSRPRPQLSCNPCRNRKLKCDRATPCNQCVKARRIDECNVPSESVSRTHIARPAKRSRQSSEERLTTAARSSSLPSPLVKGPLDHRFLKAQTLSNADTSYGIQISDLLARVKTLENSVFNSQSNIEILAQRSRPEVDALADHTNKKTQSSSNTHHFSVDAEGARVRYRGGLRRFALIEQFEAVRAFIPRAIRDPQLSLALQCLLKLQKSRSVKLDINRRETCASHDELKAKVLRLLPSREICHQLLDSYFKHWETIFRIVHTVRFRILFNISWNDNGPDHLDLSFLLQLMLIVAIGGQKFGRQILLDSDFGNNACTLAQEYLNSCHSKTKQEFSTLQVWTLLLLTRQAYLVPMPKLWLETGNLLRHAMAIGLHRDPSEAKTISPYTSELRRRLWATILEFDLQASLAYGMPMSITESEISCDLPSNIADVDMKHDCSILPEPRPEDQWTETYLQRLLAKSCGLRMRALQALASRGSNVSLLEITRMCRELKELFDDTGSFTGWNGSGPLGRPYGGLGGLLYQTHIWQVYYQLMQQTLAGNISGHTQSSRNDLIAMATSTVRLLVEANTTLKVRDEGNSEKSMCCCIFMALSRQPILQASLILCTAIQDSQHENFEWNGSTTSFVKQITSYVEVSLSSFVDGLPYGDIKDILLLAITLKFVTEHNRTADEVCKSMQEEALSSMKACESVLERAPASSSNCRSGWNCETHEPIAPTPDSTNTMLRDDLSGPVENLTFADLGFDSLDDWPEIGSFW